MSSFQQQKLSRLNVPQSLLAVMCDVSQPTLSKYLNGTQYSDDLFKRVDRAIDRLDRFKTAVGVLPVDWSQAKAVKDLIDKIDEGSIRISIIDLEPPDKLRGYVIRLGPNQGYYQRNRKGEIVAVLNQFQGILVGKEVAEQLVKLLVVKGYRPSIEECTTGDLESISLELSADVWPVEEKVA